MNTVFRIDATTELPATTGGKALGLREIVRAGLAIPPAWVVLPGCAAHALETIVAAFTTAGVTHVAVRSSAADEDGVRHSFAGIHETKLGVPLTGIAEAVATVAASADTERARAYRVQRGLAPPSGPCPVVVQAMIDADWAGVAFSRGRGVLVEAVEGLGEIAVNGEATPESIDLRREGDAWHVARRFPRRQRTSLRMAASAVERVELSGALPPLPDHAAVRIAAGLAALERAQSVPLDIEWAARGDEVVFLQARPQTRSLDFGLMPGQTWTRANVRDVFPELPSAAAREGAIELLNRALRVFYRRLGLPFAESFRFVVLVAGRMVFNEQAHTRAADEMGLSRNWGGVIIGGAGEGTNAFVRPSLFSLLRSVGLVVRTLLLIRGAERDARSHIEVLRAEARRLVAVEPATLSDDELLARAQAFAGGLFDESVFLVLRVATAFQVAVNSGATTLSRHSAPAALMARLVDPELVSVSTLQLEDLVELARSFRAWEGGCAFLDTIGPEHAARAHWRGHLPRELWAETERWLTRYGHRGPYESDFAAPRPADDLRLLATALRPMVLAAEDPEPREVRRARRRGDAEAAWQEVRQRLGWWTALRVRGPTRTLSRLMLVREELRSEMMRVNHFARRDVLDLGRRLVARGRLEAAEDVFHLASDERARALRDPAFDARAAVARERARLAAWRRIEVPNRFTSDEAGTLASGVAAKALPDGILRGTAVSPGEVEGPARLLRTPDDEAKMRPGDILVAPATDPGWTPLFARAAGVVVEIGGVMSHSATVAREYGLPCVSNVEGALGRLHDGEVIRVDGTRGTVEVVGPAS